mmetsp:Transcript_8422/g.21571  ORF Transcript_8422/g.21571 Transcript_8422/m.21571 type:complete len:325 (-) Transcript_8422:35-1009(-)
MATAGSALPQVRLPNRRRSSSGPAVVVGTSGMAAALTVAASAGAAILPPAVMTLMLQPRHGHLTCGAPDRRRSSAAGLGSRRTLGHRSPNMASVQLRAAKRHRQVHLAMTLSNLPAHPTQNAKMEQYATDGDVAAQWLNAINSEEPFEGADCVADLGAGNGILGIGALLLGAPRVVFVEADADACAAIEKGVARNHLGLRAEVLCTDVKDVDPTEYACDVVVMNPPWGQQRRSADRPFLDASVALARRSVHVLHSAGAVHVEPWAVDVGWRAERWMEAELPLPRHYAHQTKRRGFTAGAMWWLRPASDATNKAVDAAMTADPAA